VNESVRQDYKPLRRRPPRLQGGASVQQGLSAVLDIVRFDGLCGASDKRSTFRKKKRFSYKPLSIDFNGYFLSGDQLRNEYCNQLRIL
jgi:hypothetical protein